MPIPVPRDFQQWMRSIERRLSGVERRGFTSVIEYVDRQDQSIIDDIVGGGGGDPRTPAAPTVVNYSPSLYVDDNAKTWARLSVTFNAVTLATDATAITVDRYELWGREWDGVSSPEPEWRHIAASGANAFVVSSFEQNSQWRFKVRAIGTTTVNPGLFSPEAAVTMVADSTPPPPPSRPIVTVTMGVFQVEWDGLTAAAGSMPPDFDHIEIAAGPTSSPTLLTGREMSLAGSETFIGIPYGQRRYFRFRAVDTSGNASAWSANGSGISEPLVSIDGISLDGTLKAEMEAAQTAANAAAAARSDADALQADADLAQADADAEQAEADAALSTYNSVKATQDAVMLSESGKTSIVYQASAPTGDGTVLWIDTSVWVAKVWTGSWVALNDPEVTAALALVSAAFSDWNTAQAEADAAQTAADAAQATADAAEATAVAAEAAAAQALADATAEYVSAMGSKNITYSINDPSGDGETVGHTWWKRDGTGTVIGQWEWDGATWQSRPVGSEQIANLDVGKLTASAALIDTLVAQKIAAESGEFIDLVAENFSANLIKADYIDNGAVQTRHLTVGAVRPSELAFGVDNYAPNPVWSDISLRLLYTPPAGWSYVNTPSLLEPGQTHVLAMVPGVQEMAIAPRMAVSPGDKFYLSMLAKRPDPGDWEPEFGLDVQDAAGAPVPSTHLVADGGLAQRTNLLHNPSFEVDAVGFSAIVGATVARSTAQFDVGVASASVLTTTTQGSGARVATTAADAVAEGEEYRVSARIRLDTGKNLSFRAEQYDALGALLSSEQITVAGSTGVWQSVTLDVTAENGAVKIVPSFIDESASTTTFYVDALKVEIAATSELAGNTYFDGSTPAGGSWTGTAHASSSTRTDIPDGYYEVNAVITVPETGTSVAPTLYAQGSTGTWHISRLAVRRVFASSNIAEQGLQFSPSGLVAWAAGDTGEPTVRLSTNSDDILTLTDRFDRVGVVLTASGQVSAKTVSASQEVVYKGRPLTEVLDDRTSKAVAHTGSFPATLSNVNSEYGLVEVEWTVKHGGNRIYLFHLINLYFGHNGNAVGIRVRVTTNGSQPLITSSLFAEYQTYPYSGGSFVAHSPTFAGGNQLNNLAPGTRVRALVSVYSITGGNFSYVNANNPRLVVMDAGPQLELGGIISSGGGALPGQGATPPPASSPVREYESDPTPRKWYRSYRGDGTPYDFDPSSHYQGYYPGLPANGIHKSAIGAPDQMFTDLAGATVLWIKVRLKAKHWYYASGGTAVLGLHGYSTDPGSWPGTIALQEVEDFGRGDEIWVTLNPSCHAGFKSTAYRGITLYGPSTSALYYGKFEASRTAWWWAYKK